MKQEAITFLSTLNNEIFNISKYLYDNPETSFNEFNSCNYLTNLLEEHNFEITKNLLNIPTAFSAKHGTCHPKICFICEYDAPKNHGHITGHNLISSMSIGAALSLAKVIDKLKGTVIILGCPGEFAGSSKITMKKQGIFDDIDAVLMAHPDIITAESGTSLALLPLNLTFKGNKNMGHSALDSCLLTFNCLNSLSNTSKNITIDKISSKSSYSHDKTSTNFIIRGKNMECIMELENKIKNFIKSVSGLMNTSNNINIYQLPYEELITNKILSRLFSHNLKESGIIDIKGPKDSYLGLSLGSISHCVPCIHPYISIVKNSSISYHSEEFAKATISDYAHTQVMRAAQSLALTGLDLIENSNLLNEITCELCKK